MSNYLKFFKSEFEKYAQEKDDVPPPPTRRVPKKTTSPTKSGPPIRKSKSVPSNKATQPAGGGQSTGFVKDQEVIKMQEALINLATTVNSQIKTKDINKDIGSWGRTSFGDFVIKHYMRDSGEGVESSMDPAAIKHDKAKQTGPNRMLAIMDTMSRIGGTDIKMQFAPDGKWGPKTNDGLHNAKAFAYSMLKMAGDFGITLESYNNENLQKFSIPKEYNEWDNETKHKAAPILTTHIKLITSMFNEVKNKILEDPKNKAYIEAKEPYMSYRKIVPLSPYDQAIIDQWSKNRDPGNNLLFKMSMPGRPDAMLNATINLSDLISPDHFNKWLESNDAKELKQTGVTKEMIIGEIRKSLQSMIPAPSAPAPVSSAPAAPAQAKQVQKEAI